MFSGGRSGTIPSGKARKEILEFNYETETWTVIGAMKETRREHAVSAVSFKDYEKWCN